MRIFSCDIGCKNFAYCILEIDDTNKERPFKILYWELLNICSESCLCSKQLKKNKCQNKAVYIDKLTNICYCTKHKPKDISLNKIKTTDKDNLYTYGRNMYDELNKRKYILDCDIFLIENQPNRLNPTMKSISMILYSYFIFNNIKAQFINANLKLRLNNTIKHDCVDSKSNKYTLTKKIGVCMCKYILNYETVNYLDFFEYFNNHKKKDDLSDAFLHAIVYYRKIKYYDNNENMLTFIKDNLK